MKRADTKRIAPGMWAVHGGKVVSGETSLQASIRELKEEIGICINPENLKGPTRYKRKIKNEFCDIYVLSQDVDLKDIKLQNEEVKDIKCELRASFWLPFNFNIILKHSLNILHQVE
jgi:8-oxo-dGTP pyrophosphatase MutT (NUDIX family)